jgi:hypothetical protein
LYFYEASAAKPAIDCCNPKHNPIQRSDREMSYHRPPNSAIASAALFHHFHSALSLRTASSQAIDDAP